MRKGQVFQKICKYYHERRNHDAFFLSHFKPLVCPDWPDDVTRFFLSIYPVLGMKKVISDQGIKITEEIIQYSLFRVWNLTREQKSLFRASKETPVTSLGCHFSQGSNPCLGCFLKGCGHAWCVGHNWNDTPPPPLAGYCTSKFFGVNGADFCDWIYQANHKCVQWCKRM